MTLTSLADLHDLNSTQNTARNVRLFNSFSLFFFSLVFLYNRVVLSQSILFTVLNSTVFHTNTPLCLLSATALLFEFVLVCYTIFITSSFTLLCDLKVWNVLWTDLLSIKWNVITSSDKNVP